MNEIFTIPCIDINADGISIFSTEAFPQQWRGAMLLSDQVPALNLRLRKSEAGYLSDWHVAGDPTLIVVLQGTLRIILRDDTFKDFSVGDQFIAKDYTPKNLRFDDRSHGHRAEVLGPSSLEAIHIKLSISK